MASSFFALFLWILIAGCTAHQAASDEKTGSFSFVDETGSPSAYVTESFLMHHLGILAHDSLMGRGTGQDGSRMAADYLEQFYRSDSFSYSNVDIIRQSFTLEGIFWDSVSYDLYQLDGQDTLFISRSRMDQGTGASFIPLIDGTEIVDAPVVFAGYGFSRTYSASLASSDGILQGAWVMLFEPGADEGVSRRDVVRNFTANGANGVIFINDAEPDEWEVKATAMSRQLQRPMAIREPGSSFRMSPRTGGTAVSIHPELALRMLHLDDFESLDSLRQYWRANIPDAQPVLTGFRFRNKPEINTRLFEEDNIIAVIPGADDDLRNEVVVLTAHYDHMGTGEPDDHNQVVYYGADDNASGTAILLQIAKAFQIKAQKGYQPSRTLVFLHTAAEEWGLYGAFHYAKNPIFPLNLTIANVNVDMVGFVDNRYSREEDQNYVYVIGANMVSSVLDKLVGQANRATANLKLDEIYNDTGHYLGLYRRSDHWAFAEKNIPFVFFFSGLHNYYHRPADTPDRINGALLTKRAELITELVWYLAETDERPEVDRKRLGRGRLPGR